jgi:hypothetical protein
MGTFRFLSAQALIFVLGAVLLWRAASPLSGYWSSLDSEDWGLIAEPALFFGSVGGIVEGLCIRRDHLVVAIVVAVISGLPALYVPLFVATPVDDLLRTEPTELIAALLGWTLFIATSVTASSAVGLIRRH